MSKQGVNTLLEENWSRFADELEREAKQRVEAMQFSFNTGDHDFPTGHYRISGNLHEARLKQISLGKSLGYVTLPGNRLSLALPLDEDGWSLDFEARLTLTMHVGRSMPFNGFDRLLRIDLKGKLDQVRLVVDAELEDDTTDRPRLKSRSFAIHPSLRLRLKGLTENPLEVHLQEVSQEGVRKLTTGPLTGKVVKTLLPPEIDEVAFNVTATVNWSEPAQLIIQGRINVRLLLGLVTIPIDIDQKSPLGSVLPGALGALLSGGPAPALPQDWGRAALTLSPPPAGTDFAAAAAELEQVLLDPDLHLPGGLIYDRREVRRIAPAPDGPAPSHPELPDVTYEGYIDTAIWSGHYLAAEAFRFGAATTAAERRAALAQMGCVLDGIDKLFRVTHPEGRLNGLLARCALVADAPVQTWPPLNEPPADKKERYYGPVEIDGRDWFGYGGGDHPPSRDSYTGIMLGLAYAHHFLGLPSAGVAPNAETRALRGQAKDMVNAALEFLEEHGWTIPTPPHDRVRTHFVHEFGPQLAFLRVGKSVDANQWADRYDEAAKAADTLWFSTWASCLDPVGTYYKFNLAHACLGLLLFFETDATLRGHYTRAFGILRRTIRHHRNAYFDLVRVLTEAPANRAGVLASRTEGCDPDFTLQEQIAAILAEWLQRRDLAAGPNGLPTQATPAPAALRALFPQEVAAFTPLFPKISLETGTTSQARPMIVGLEALPAQHRPGMHMDFLWQRDPFDTGLQEDPRFEFPNSLLTVDSGRPAFEGPGVDYLLAYWMARYLQAI